MVVSWDPASKVTDLILYMHGSVSILDSVSTEAGIITSPLLSTVATVLFSTQTELSDVVGAVLLAVSELNSIHRPFDN